MCFYYMQNNICRIMPCFLGSKPHCVLCLLLGEQVRSLFVFFFLCALCVHYSPSLPSAFLILYHFFEICKSRKLSKSSSNQQAALHCRVKLDAGIIEPCLTFVPFSSMLGGIGFFWEVTCSSEF